MRVILVTGANGSLGLAMAGAFLHEGSANLVWLGVRRGRDQAAALAAQYPDRAVCPGYLETSALALMSAEAPDVALAQVPMRRFGRPAEVAAAVRFLASPDAGYITGSVLKIDGGIL